MSARRQFARHSITWSGGFPVSTTCTISSVQTSGHLLDLEHLLSDTNRSNCLTTNRTYQLEDILYLLFFHLNPQLKLYFLWSLMVLRNRGAVTFSRWEKENFFVTNIYAIGIFFARNYDDEEENWRSVLPLRWIEIG